MASPFRSIPLAALAAAVLAAACGNSNDAARPAHSVTDVRSALRAVGLTGFRVVPHAEMRTGKQVAGVDPAKILGGFEFARVGTTGSVVAVTIAVVGDPSIIRRMEADIATEGEAPTLVLRHAEAQNVVVFSVASRPTAADRALLARIPKLVTYLKRQGE